MRRLRQSANEAQDLLLVYYAGHGLRHERRDDLYLTVRQSNPSGLDGTAVEYDWVRDVIADSPARARLLVLDCCYSGLALERMSATAVDPRELVVSGTSVLASSPRNKQSHSPRGDRYTAFTKELLALLVDGSPLADTPLTVQNTYQSIRAGLAKRGLPLPTLRSDDTSGQVLLRREPPVVRDQPASPDIATGNAVPDQPVQPSQGAAEQPPRRTEQPPREAEQPPRRAWSEPAPAGFARLSAPSEVRKAVLRAGRRLSMGLLWFLFTFGWAFGLGGLAGVVFGPANTQSADLNIAFAGLGITAAGGLVLVFRARRRSRERSIWRGLLASVPSFDKVPMVLLLGLAAACVGGALTAAIGGVSSTERTTSGSDLAFQIELVTLFVTWAAISGRAFARRLALRHETAASDQG